MNALMLDRGARAKLLWLACKINLERAYDRVIWGKDQNSGRGCGRRSGQWPKHYVAV